MIQYACSDWSVKFLTPKEENLSALWFVLISHLSLERLVSLLWSEHQKNCVHCHRTLYNALDDIFSVNPVAKFIGCFLHFPLCRFTELQRSQFSKCHPWKGQNEDVTNPFSIGEECILNQLDFRMGLANYGWWVKCEFFWHLKVIEKDCFMTCESHIKFEFQCP